MVEDDGGIAQVMKLALQQGSSGYRVDHAYTAEEAVLLWEQGGYDLLLSDYNLRGKNGLDLIAQIKEREATLPTVLVTAYDTPPLRREAARVGVSHFVAKPFFVDQLVDLVKSLVPSAS